jgi:hypothetical protein
MKNKDNVTNQNAHTIKRDFAIKNIVVHIKSIFNGHTTLDKALCNIIVRKLSQPKK